MTRLNKFVTPQELATVQAAISYPAIFSSGGKPLMDPEFEVGRLVAKYDMPKGTALDPNNGEFVDPLDKPSAV